MSALVERIIAARDCVKRVHKLVDRDDQATLQIAIDAMADAANALTERDETIHYLRGRFAKVDADLYRRIDLHAFSLDAWASGEDAAAAGLYRQQAADIRALLALVKS